MATVHPSIDDALARWILQQHVFFVSTAPLDAGGLINCSPKGLDSLAILDPNSVAYLDMTGSGAETIANLKENGRIVIMFCAFDGPAQIVRLHGQGHVIEPHHPDFEHLRSHLPDLPGVRSIIRVDVSRVSDSCGYGVPKYEYQEQRPTLVKWAAGKGPEGIAAYQAKNNRISLNGLPAVESQ